jgi:predicted transcriptional regulator
MSFILTADEKRFFRDQLRAARAGALLDAESFYPLVAALERLGAALMPTGKNLGAFRDDLLSVAGQAPASPVDSDDRANFMPLDVLFLAVKNGRNDAVHQGAFARHLVRHCVQLALLVEDGLMADSRCVADFMVRDAVCAEPWQQVAVARQRMLIGSYSYLPIWISDEWRLLSDHAVASYLVSAAKPVEAIRKRISTVFETQELALEPAVVLDPDTSVAEAIKTSLGRPVIVVQGGRLVGIATSFDFL